MPGTKAGGKKVDITLADRLGSPEAVHTWRQEIGRLGGKKSKGGGFAKDPELARRAGSKGGRAARKPAEAVACDMCDRMIRGNRGLSLHITLSHKKEND